VDEIIESIPKLQGYNCFACGTANPIGLNLSFLQTGEVYLFRYNPGKKL